MTTVRPCRAFLQNPPPFFLVAEYPYLPLLPLKCNSKLEARGERGTKGTETTSKIREKWNTASHSFYKAIRTRVVCLETMLGINPIGIDLVIEGLPLYVCSSELSLAHGCSCILLQGYRLPITNASGAYGRRSYLTRIAFRIKKANACELRIQQYRQCRFKLSAVIGSLVNSQHIDI